jgi:hypothetical protein
MFLSLKLVSGATAVRGGVPEREEEGLVAGRGVVDQLDAAPGLEVGQVLARVRGVGIRLQHPVFEGLPGHVVEGGRMRQPVPVGPPRWYAVLRLVAVQVAPDVHGAVAGVLQPHGQGVRRVELDEAAEGRIVVQHAVVVRVLPGEVRRAGRAAEREAVDRLVELRAVGREQVVHVLHRGERGRGLVVGHDHDDVLARGRGRRERKRGRRCRDRRRYSSQRPSPR